MNDKIDWMLGMSENMMNIAVKNMEKPMMNEMYSMTSSLMGNLNQMKVRNNIPMNMINVMEQMMRSMETTMAGLDMDNEMQKKMMMQMMHYMTIMQMSTIMDMMK